MARKVVIPFFTDQNVPDSAGRFLEEAGHEVTKLRDVMAENSPDKIIAVAVSRSGQVLVSHDKDFKDVAKRLNITQRQFRKALHRVSLRCEEPADVERLKEALSLIEHEWQLIRDNRPMVIEVRSNSILVHR